MTYKEIGQAVLFARKVKEWTQEEAAEKCKISKRLYISVEKGEGTASIKTYNLIADKFKIGFSLTFPVK